MRGRAKPGLAATWLCVIVHAARPVPRRALPAATGLKRYRTIDIAPSEKVPLAMYTRPHTEAELLAALEEIGADGGDLDLGALGIDFGGAPLHDEDGDGMPREFPEATEIPEIDSPLDEGAN